MKEVSIDQVKQAIVVLSVMLEIEEDVKVSLENKPILDVIKDIAYHLFVMDYNHNAETDDDIYDAYEIVLSYAEKTRTNQLNQGDDTMTTNEKNYPYLGIYKEENPEEAQVVYFTSECTGIVVISNEFNKKGHECDYWEQDLFEICSNEDIKRLIRYKKVLKEIKQKQKYEFDKVKSEAIEKIFTETSL